MASSTDDGTLNARSSSPCRPSVTSTRPTENSPKPIQSKRCASAERRSGMKRSAANTPSTPTGRLIRKTQCQLAISTSQPPSGGPTRGPSKPGIVTKASTLSNSARGNARRIVRRPTGSSSAPPTPCRTRAAISHGSDGDSAHSSEPRLNSTIAQRNARWVPNRSASQPDAGMNKATVSM